MSECFSKKFPKCGIFGHLVERWHTEAGEADSHFENNFDEKAYFEVLTTIKPEHFVKFLHQLLCIYPSANKFLIDCLHQTNQDIDIWDT